MKKFARCSLFDKTKFSILIIFAFSSWPFFYYGFWTSKVIFVSSALSLAILFLLDIKKVDSIYLVCFSCFCCFYVGLLRIFLCIPKLAKNLLKDLYYMHRWFYLLHCCLPCLPIISRKPSISFLSFLPLLSIPCMLLSFAYLFGVDNFILQST